MAITKYAIYMPILDKYVQYDDMVLLFDSKEQIATFKEDFAEFFKNAPGASVIREVDAEAMAKQYIVMNYTDLPQEAINSEKEAVANPNKVIPPPSKQEMYDLLCNDFSPENVASDMPSVFARRLIEAGIITSMADFNFLALEAIQHAFADDDEFPIHYYRKGEEMSESGRVVTDIGDCLTDDYIAANLANPT